MNRKRCQIERQLELSVELGWWKARVLEEGSTSRVVGREERVRLCVPGQRRSWERVCSIN